ncbi:testis-expressed protein 38-like [Sciurus carolinensis]|uniref:testis-expressed protein 38-like n=1 Tax=Sciurus carolinensis TaxID=30640 RepID=UPI001FB48E6A|nr:testis-expressed protein 38-like [Sciurus carolinensis]
MEGLSDLNANASETRHNPNTQADLHHLPEQPRRSLENQNMPFKQAVNILPGSIQIQKQRALVLLYFGLMGLCCVATGGCIIFIHWRKKLQWDKCAQQWMEVMNGSTFIYNSLLYWINMQRRHGINAAIKIGPPTAVTNTEMKDHIPDCLWESDTPETRDFSLRGSIPRAETPVAMQAALVVSGQPTSNQMPQHQTRSPFPIPIFQEIPFAPSLHKMPPMLEHTVSYLLDIYPERNVHYHSLPTLALKRTVSMPRFCFISVSSTH